MSNDQPKNPTITDISARQATRADSAVGTFQPRSPSDTNSHSFNATIYLPHEDDRPPNALLDESGNMLLDEDDNALLAEGTREVAPEETHTVIASMTGAIEISASVASELNMAANLNAEIIKRRRAELLTQSASKESHSMAGVDLSPPSTPPNVEGMPEAEAIKAMVAWFLENFDDPAEETPYESAEGGYQYIWGGPYGAGEELFAAFGDAVPFPWIEKAAEQVQDIAGVYDWAPSSNRFFEEPGDEEDESAPSDFEILQGRLKEIEATLSRLAPAIPRIGHNQPPSPIDDVAVTEKDVTDLRAAIVVLRAQEQFPSEVSPQTVAAAETMKSFRSKALSYIAKLADTFATSLASEAGKRTAQVASLYMFYSLLEKLVANLGDAIKAFEAWLHVATLF